MIEKHVPRRGSNVRCKIMGLHRVVANQFVERRVCTKRNKQQTNMERSLSVLEETETRKPKHNNYTNKGMHKGGDLTLDSAWL